jgi:hemin uptake protein HemP
MTELIHKHTSNKKTVHSSNGQHTTKSPLIASYDSTDLLQGQIYALLNHNSQVYTLRLTAQNKLILTK